MIQKRLKSIQFQKEYLEKEKQELQQLKQTYEQLLKEIEQDLKQLNGIEQKLFYEITINGLNVTKAVDKVSVVYDLDPSTIWKNYYPPVKEFLKSLQTQNNLANC